MVRIHVAQPIASTPPALLFPMKLPRCLLVVAASLSLAADAAPTGEVLREFVYETAPYPECHASTIAETPTGLVASWFGGTKEKHPDVGIWVARKEGGRWTTPVEVANGVQSDGKRQPCWNPVLHRSRSGALLLFYKVGPSPETWKGLLRTSSDDGRTWSAPIHFVPGILGPVRNHAVELADGTLLCGSSTEDGGWKLHFERTRNDGLDWERCPSVPDPLHGELIQPALAVLGPERVAAFCRSRHGTIFRTDTSDGGKSWSEPHPTLLPNPNSGIDAVTLRDGRILLVYNHADGNWGNRSPLNVAVSKDGDVWEAAAVLEDQPNREFSYPAVIQSDDGLVHVTYTWKRKRICHVVLDPAKLATHPIADWDRRLRPIPK